ncbi:gastrin/cholecystokinin type B receptor [Cherax quadricarinatus]|uniref:gastrin/cholecystokinin type B receptor n=1 Tax=Cherax quadricarinatus TaxID=27406 RepID=UPI0023781B26|nr:alpha-2B adrenergic receptor-like [Cherax quadricarinatus]
MSDNTDSTSVVWSTWAGVALAALQVGMFMVGVLGNVTVAASVWRRRTGHQQQLAAHRLDLLLSLALADLLVTLLCLPAATSRFLALSWSVPWVLWCPLLSAAQNTAHAASTLSLTLLALDRYLTVRRPKLAPRVSAVTAQLLVALWLAAALMALPRGLAARLQAPGPVCREVWPFPAAGIVYHTAIAAIVHLVPCAAVVLCHAAVAASLRRRGKDDTRLNLRPRQVIIMARDCSLGGANNHKIIAASSSGESEEEERAALKVPDGTMPHGSRDVGRGRGPLLPARAMATMKPSKDIHTIIRAHRRMRMKGPTHTPSIFTSYRGHSVATRRRLARLLVALGALFATCWTPYVVALVVWACRESPGTQHALEVTLVLGHAHSAVNPVVYWLMNRAFLSSLHHYLSVQWHLPEALSCARCPRPACITRPHAPPWAPNSSTNEDNLGPFHPKYLNPHTLRPQISRCTSHYFH